MLLYDMKSYLYLLLFLHVCHINRLFTYILTGTSWYSIIITFTVYLYHLLFLARECMNYISIKYLLSGAWMSPQYWLQHCPNPWFQHLTKRQCDKYSNRSLNPWFFKKTFTVRDLNWTIQRCSHNCSTNAGSMKHLHLVYHEILISGVCYILSRLIPGKWLLSDFFCLLSFIFNVNSSK